MKFLCNQQALSKCLNIVQKAVTSRTTIPILKGILLKVSENGILTMSASDLDLSIEKSIEVTDFEVGEIVVPAKLFGDIIRKLPNEKIHIKAEDRNLTINCLNSSFNLICSSADEFPTIVMDENSENIVLDKEIVRKLINKTAFAASIDEAKGVITGILIELGEREVNFVSLDGFRMAIARGKIDFDGNKKIIIPAKMMMEIGKIISEDDSDIENIEINTNEKRAEFIVNNTRIIIRLLEGEFVKYKDILPKEAKINIILNKNELLNSIERASLLAKIGKNNLVKFEINNETIEITSKSEEGNVNESVNISKTGDDLTIGFNSKYLIDALKVIEDENILMLFNNSISPCLIKPINGNEYEYLILPVRITNN